MGAMWGYVGLWGLWGTVVPQDNFTHEALCATIGVEFSETERGRACLRPIRQQIVDLVQQAYVRS